MADGGGVPVVLDRQPPVNGTPFTDVDLADSAAAALAVRALIDRVGPPSAVVTAAGTDACGRLEDISPDAWERVVRVNLFGTVAVIRECLPHLEVARGRIVTVASTLALKGVSDATAYCASKFAVRGFTQSLAAELAGRVGVTLLVPGGMRTAFFDGRTRAVQARSGRRPAGPVHRGVRRRHRAATSRRAAEIREMLVMSSGESSWP